MGDLLRRLFEGQLLHILLLAALLLSVGFLSQHQTVIEGQLWGWSASTWLWLSVVAAILHQGYVWLVWRLELHSGTVSRHFPDKGFELFKAGFGLLGLGRWSVIPLAVANRGTLELPGIVQWGGLGAVPSPFRVPPLLGPSLLRHGPRDGPRPL